MPERPVEQKPKYLSSICVIEVLEGKEKECSTKHFFEEIQPQTSFVGGKKLSTFLGVAEVISFCASVSPYA